jgi:hypothetical protein
MSTSDAGGEPSTRTPGLTPGDARLEVVVLPVSDVDRAKRFSASWASFSDPDGNGRLLQEITTRLPGR